MGFFAWIADKLPNGGHGAYIEEKLVNVEHFGPLGMDNYDEAIALQGTDHNLAISNGIHQLNVSVAEAGQIIDAYFTATMVIDGGELAVLLGKAGYKVVAGAAGKACYHYWANCRRLEQRPQSRRS